MRKNFMKTAYARTLAVVLATGMIVTALPGSISSAKAKKPKLSKTKVTITVGKSQKVTVKNAKKVTWTVNKAGKKIVTLSKKSKKGATIKGKKKGSAKITVKMKSGKKTYKKTIKVTVKKKVVVKKATPTPKVTAKASVAPTAPAYNATKAPGDATTAPTADSNATAAPTADSTATAAPTADSTATAAPTADSTATAAPTASSNATPTPTAPAGTSIPMATPVLGEHDLAVAISEDNEYLKANVSNVAYNNGVATYTASADASGGGIYWNLKLDKSSINVADYSKIKIIASTKQGNTPVVLCVATATSPSDFYHTNEIGFDGYKQYASTGEANTETSIEFDLSQVTEANKNSDVYGIMLKYNAYDPDGTKGYGPVDFTIRSIVLEGKDGSEVVPTTEPTSNPTTAPTTVPTAVPTLAPTPVPGGVASGSACVSVVTGTAVSGAATSLTVKTGETFGLNAVIVTSGCAVSGGVVWASEDSSIASVSGSGVSAVVTAEGEGTTDILATITTDTGITTWGRFTVTVESGKYVLEGDALGAGAAYTYVANGAAQYTTVSNIKLDASKLSADTPLTITYKATAANGDTDLTSQTEINQIICLGDKWNSVKVTSPGYGKTGGTLTFNLTQDDIDKITNSAIGGYVQLTLSRAGFTGSFTTLSVKVGEENAYEGDLSTYKYAFVESGLGQYGKTASVSLPNDLDLTQFTNAVVEYTVNDTTGYNNFQCILENYVDGSKKDDPKYNAVNNTFTVPISATKATSCDRASIFFQSGTAGFTGSVTITKITFEP